MLSVRVKTCDWRSKPRDIGLLSLVSFLLIPNMIIDTGLPSLRIVLLMQILRRIVAFVSFSDANSGVVELSGEPHFQNHCLRAQFLFYFFIFYLSKYGFRYIRFLSFEALFWTASYTISEFICAIQKVPFDSSPSHNKGRSYLYLYLTSP
jgi:hypothetical protein